MAIKYMFYKVDFFFSSLWLYH